MYLNVDIVHSMTNPIPEVKERRCYGHGIGVRTPHSALHGCRCVF